MQNKFFILGLLLVLISCAKKEEEKFVPTKFSADVEKYELEQVFEDPKSDQFVAVFFTESEGSIGSGNKVLKLYSADSTSTDEATYGAHPLVVNEWRGNTLKVSVNVFSTHGDSLYRKKYLDSWLDRNKKIGTFKIEYEKDYGY